LKSSKYKTFFYLLFFLSTSIILQQCSVDEPIVFLEESGYPKEVGNIILKSCAIKGCHNDASKDAAAGLSLSSWDRMFEGGRGGAVTIPYSHKLSSLFLFTNTYKDLGAANHPTMPINSAPLSKEEVIILRDWIDAGAPNNKGFVKFSDNPNRKKYYVVNQGCDLVTVVDQETGLIMRYVKVGRTAQTEAPHNIKISPDGKYWYVIFVNGDVIQKYRTSDDSFVGEINIGLGSWNTFTITSDSKKAFIADFNTNGVIAYVNLEELKLIVKYTGYAYPHGIYVNKASTRLYVCSESSNVIYKIDISAPLSPEDSIINIPNAAAHEIIFTADENKYFVTSRGTNNIRIFNAVNDQLIATIPTANFPQEISLSNSSPYLFVTCMEDTAIFPGSRGAVTVINYQNNSFVKNLNPGFQPHGIAVDDQKNLVYVANRNISSGGPAPHHSTECGGKNGFISFIDIRTLDMIPNKRLEVSVDPYAIDIRK